MKSSHPAFLSDAIENWRLGIIVATIVAIILALGLLMRAPYLAEAKVEIGGITTEGTNGLVRFLPFETAEQIEEFYAKHVFVNPHLNPENKCSAKGVYFPVGLMVIISCRGEAENQVREMVSVMPKPLLDRHAKTYALAKTYYEQRLNRITREIHERGRIVDLFQKTPTSVLEEAEIIKQQISIEALRENQAFEQLLGSRVRSTHLDDASISVVNRQPVLRVWAVVLLLSLGSGLITAVFTAKLKQIEV